MAKDSQKDNKDVKKMYGKRKNNKVKSTTIDEKIELFEKFFNDPNVHENLNGNTIYDGYPLGKYAIQIRSLVKNNKGLYNSEKIDKIKELGILDRQIEATIEEKVEFLKQFAKNNPKIMQYMTKTKGLNVPEYDKKFEDIKEETKKFNRYYDYIVSRKRKNKLKPELYDDLIKSNVGGIFEDNSAIEEFLEKSGNICDTDRKFLKEMIIKYGNVEEFKKHYIEELTYNPYLRKKDELSKFFRGIDLCSQNLYIQNYGYTKLNHPYKEPQTIAPIINSKEMDIIIDSLPLGCKNTIKLLYTCKKNERYTKKEIAEKNEVTEEKIKIISTRATGLFHKYDHEKNLNSSSKEENIGDLYNFLNNFIKVYGIINNDNLSSEKREQLLELYNKSCDEKKILNRNIELLKYAGNDTKKEILKNEFGEYIKNDTISLHFFDRSGGEINRADKNLSIQDFGNNEVNDENRNKVFEAAIKLAALNEKNVEIFNVLKNKEEKNISFSKMPISYLGLDGNIMNNISAKYVIDIVKNDGNNLKFKQKLNQKEQNDIINEVSVALSNKGLHFNMNYDEINEFIKTQEKTIKNINDLNISEINKKILDSLGIYTIEDFKNATYKDISNFGGDAYIEAKQKMINIKEEDIRNIGDIGLSNATVCFFRDNGIETTEDFLKNEKKLKNIGKDAYAEVVKNGKIYGLNISAKKDEFYDKTIMQNKSMSIKELGLSVKTYGCLKRAGLKTVNDILEKTEKEIKLIRNLGDKSYDEVIEKINYLGLSLKENEENNIECCNERDSSIKLKELIAAIRFTYRKIKIKEDEINNLNIVIKQKIDKINLEMNSSKQNILNLKVVINNNRIELEKIGKLKDIEDKLMKEQVALREKEKELYEYNQKITENAKEIKNVQKEEKDLKNQAENYNIEL